MSNYDSLVILHNPVFTPAREARVAKVIMIRTEYIIVLIICHIVLGIWVRKCPFREFLGNNARPSLKVGYGSLESPKKSLPLKLPQNMPKSATPFYLYFQPWTKIATLLRIGVETNLKALK